MKTIDNIYIYVKRSKKKSFARADFLIAAAMITSLIFFGIKYLPL